jgi:hypothetical protein
MSRRKNLVHQFLCIIGGSKKNYREQPFWVQGSTTFYIKTTSINMRDSPSSLGSRIQPPRPKIATNPQKYGTVHHKSGPNFCKKGVRIDICFYSMMTPGKKLKEVIVYGHVLGQKIPLVSPNSPPTRRNNSRKIRTVTEK